MIQRHREGATHQGMAAQRAVKAGQAAHPEDLPHAVAFVAHQPAAGLIKLHFATGVGAVAELLF
ncbi:Uncharacterised protein [Klebsiella pneumoniae]|nr:Uncharacterised protein [Klebsiella pneumoniae]